MVQKGVERGMVDKNTSIGIDNLNKMRALRRGLLKVLIGLFIIWFVWQLGVSYVVITIHWPVVVIGVGIILINTIGSWYYHEVVGDWFGMLVCFIRVLGRWLIVYGLIFAVFDFNGRQIISCMTINIYDNSFFSVIRFAWRPIECEWLREVACHAANLTHLTVEEKTVLMSANTPTTIDETVQRIIERRKVMQARKEFEANMALIGAWVDTVATTVLKGAGLTVFGTVGVIMCLAGLMGFLKFVMILDRINFF